MVNNYEILDESGAVINSIVATESFMLSAYPGRYRVLQESLAPFNLAEQSALLCSRINSDVDLVYKTLIGERGPEYERAEAQALDLLAGKIFSAPMVQAWADVQSWTLQEAATDIANQAKAWRTAQEHIRAARLLHCSNARKAQDQASLQAVELSWDTTLKSLKTQLGLT